MRAVGRRGGRSELAASVVAGLLLLAAAGASEAGVRRVWAVNDSEKIARDDVRSPLAAGNSAWDGRRVLSGREAASCR